MLSDLVIFPSDGRTPPGHHRSLSQDQLKSLLSPRRWSPSQFSTRQRSDYDSLFAPVCLLPRSLAVFTSSSFIPHLCQTQPSGAGTGTFHPSCKPAVLNPWVETPPGVAYRIFCLSDIYIAIHNCCNSKLQL